MTADREAAIARADDVLAAADTQRRGAMVARNAIRSTRTLAHARRVVREHQPLTDDIRSAALALLDTTTGEDTDA